MRERLRRSVAFHRTALVSGGRRGMALWGVGSLLFGGSVLAVLTFIVGISWVVGALAASLALLMFYGHGAYLEWDKADRRAQAAEAAFAEEEAKPRGPIAFNIQGGSGNRVWDNKVIYTGNPPAMPASSPVEDPIRDAVREQVRQALEQQKDEGD